MSVGRPKSTRQLAHCREEGLSCHDCVRNSASSLAQISSGLTSSSSRQLFFSMYPDSACQPMVGPFLQVLRQNQNEELTKKPAFFLPVFEAAVA